MGVSIKLNFWERWNFDKILNLGKLKFLSKLNFGKIEVLETKFWEKWNFEINKLLELKFRKNGNFKKLKFQKSWIFGKI